jgi:hypothetical protein
LPIGVIIAIFIVNGNMHKLDPHTLFSIFEQGDEEVYKEHGELEVLKNPFVLMNMVMRGLENYQLMCLMYLKNYPKEFKRVEPTIKYKYYTKLYSYLLRINLKSIESIYTIGDSFEKKQVGDALNELLRYFESIEQYEKCGKIVEYIQMLVLEEAKNILK